MERLSRVWFKMNIYEKIALVLKSICSVSVILLVTLQLLGIWGKAINVFEPLLGVLMITQGVMQWRRDRKGAIFYFSLAILVFVITIIIFFVQ